MHQISPIQTPPRTLIAAATSADPALAAPWHPLTGGRTNRLWRVTDRVVKLYDPASATPLFPNDPDAEARALNHLAPLGLAPSPITRLSGPFGEALIYRYQQGETGQISPAALAALLHRIHTTPPPPGLRQTGSGSAALLRSVADILDLIDAPSEALKAAQNDLFRLSEVAAGPLHLIHSDPVATNVITAGEGQGLILIDWQCPALGDPCDDLAVVLSPSMQRAYGATMTHGDCEAFLAAYPQSDTVDRYRRLAPFYALRFAAYARWCAENNRGSEGEERELTAMEQALSQAAG